MKDAAQWPGILKGLLAEFSCSMVWQAGLEALGYPPNLARDTKEAMKIRQKLNDPNFIPF